METTSLVAVNTDAHNQLLSVVEGLKDENLKFKVDHYERNIGQIVSHCLNTQRYFFLKHLAEGDPKAADYKEPVFSSVAEALKAIKENMKVTNDMIASFDPTKLGEEITTEWGQTMTRELAMWQGILQIMMHLGEICLMAGEGGFYNGALG